MSAWIGVDLDGTLARYTGSVYLNPKYNNRPGIDVPIPAMVEHVKHWMTEAEVRIMTARASNPDDCAMIQEWCLEHIGTSFEVTNKKDYEMLFVADDRAKQVIPNTGILLEELIDWNKLITIGKE